MRVTSYNILNGGEGRADPLAEVILAQRADVVGIVEADNLEVLHRLGKRLNMDWVHAQGADHAAALFSRFPIVHSINHALLLKGGPRSLLEAVVRDEAGNEWTFGVLHLSPGAYEVNEKVREQEIAKVLQVFAPHRDEYRRHILLGDFNSNSPVQNIEPHHCKPSTQEAFAANGGEIPRRVMQLVLGAGYLDTLDEVHQPAAEGSGTFSTQAPGQRVDYILTWGFDPQRVTAAWIEHDRLAKYASDHYPVGAEIQ